MLVSILVMGYQRWLKELRRKQKSFVRGWSVTFNAHAGGYAVCQHSFHIALAFRNQPDFPACLGCHLLIGASLEEFPHPHAAGITRRSARGQNVIRSDGFV